MKSGTKYYVSQMLGLALADFGRDPRTSPFCFMFFYVGGRL